MPLSKPNQPIPHTGHPLGKALGAAWLLREGFGASTRDVSRFGSHGTLVNDPAWTRSPYGRALSLNGVDQYVEVGSNEALDFSDATIAWRMKWSGNTTGYDGVLARGAASLGNDGTWSIRVNRNAADRVQFRIFGQWTFDSAITPSTDWESWAMTLSGTTYRWYRNGTQVAESTNAVNGLLHQGDLWIGRYSTGGPFDYFEGQVDYLLMYRRALSAGAIARLHVAPFAAFRLPRWVPRVIPGVGGPYGVACGQQWHTGSAAGELLSAGAAAGQTL